MNVIEEAIRIWETFRAGVIAELELVPEDKWDFRPAEGARTVRALARHVVQSAAGFTDQLLLPDGAFARLFDPKYREELGAKLPKLDTKGEILDALRSQGADSLRRLRETGESLASQEMASFSGKQSRLTALWFAVSHEQYHRGQIAMYVRQLGITPAMTAQMQKRS